MPELKEDLERLLIPLETVYQEWFLKRESAEQRQRINAVIFHLIDRMSRAIQHGLPDERDYCLERLQQMEKVYRTPLELGRAELERGRGLLAKGQPAEAEQCFRQAAQEYRSYPHECAIASYFLGCVQACRADWTGAARAWKDTLDNFKRLRSEQNTGSQEEADWYTERIRELEGMQLAVMDLITTEQGGEQPRGEPAVAVPGTATPAAAAPRADWAYLFGLPVVGEVPAGGFKGGDFLKDVSEGLEVSAVESNGTVYRFYPTDGDRRIRYRPGQDFFLRVKGNSMNRALPRSIADGDLVLVRNFDLTLNSSDYYGGKNRLALQELAYNLDQKIVVAEISSQAESMRTLKRCRIEGGRIWLYPESSDPTYQPVEFRPENPDETLGISGVVIAVLKPEN